MAQNPTPTQLDSNQIFQRAFDETNDRLRVDSSATLTVPNGLEVAIDHHNDSIRLGDGTNLITATAVGGSIGLDTNIINSVKINDSTPIAVSVQDRGSLTNKYSEIMSVPANTEGTVLSYTVPVTKQALIKRIEVSGTNIGTYTVLVNNVVQTKKRTYFAGELNITIDFLAGLALQAGDVLQVKALHTRPSLGDFNSNALITETA